MGRHSFSQWMTAVRPWSFPASAMPVIVTLTYLLWKGSTPESNGIPIDWVNGVLAVIGIILFHAAGNTWSDYFDYRKKVDTPDTFGVKTLTGGMFAPEEILRLSVILLVAAIATGTVLLVNSGFTLLWIGLGGLLCTLLYPPMKYNALGDLVIMLAYAFLPTIGTSFVATGRIDWDTLLIAFPVGLITVAILHTNNTRDIASDRKAEIRTFAMDIGLKASKAIYYLEVLVPFAWIAICIILKDFPAWCLLTAAAVVPAIKNVKTMTGATEQDKSAIASLDEMTAKLQLVFSLLFALSFIIAAIF